MFCALVWDWAGQLSELVGMHSHKQKHVAAVGLTWQVHYAAVKGFLDPGNVAWVSVQSLCYWTLCATGIKHGLILIQIDLQ